MSNIRINTRESKIESSVCKYAKDNGMLAYKFTSPGHSFVPDRIFITQSGTIFFIEFKSESGKLSAGQEREIKRLLDRNVSVFIVSSIESGFDLINKIKEIESTRAKSK